MKKIIYTCDACQKRLSEEPKVTFILPIYQGYKDGLLITSSNKVQTKEIMLCSNCKHRIADLLLDLGIVSF